MKKLVVLVAGLALALPSHAAGARFALGIEQGFPAERVADRVEAATGRPVTVIGPFAVAVDVPSAQALAAVRGVSYVERLRAHRRLAFVPNDPLVARQWYADRIRAFDAWPRLPIRPRVLVAVIDSGIDADHPELEDRIAAGQSFVKSPWWWDSNGHGTFVAGQIAAETNNAQGIAGLALPADLLVAKVVRSDGTISPEAEARAIRWAVDNGADVINLSFGGMRDPQDSGRDTYSQLEAAAVEYAVKHRVLVVAAVGNGDKAPYEPWEFANYPAALPHVLGVSAIARDGTVPDFSNRDRVFNDIAAPGEGIFSTLPRALTEDRVACALKGYSECGPTEFRRGEGTSFAAPQVSAAAAILLGERPLRPEQVSAVLERSAADANPTQGCRRCSVGRDEFTGWGVLDITAAVSSLASPVPPPDPFEPNDGAATRAPRLWGARRRNISATLDFWNDEIDVYRVRLRRGQRVTAVLRGPRGAETSLLLWKPGTRSVDEPTADSRRLAARDATDGSVKRVIHRARKGGWYYLEVKLSTEISGRYTLRFSKTKPVKPPAVARRPRRT
jgi:subtilisin family serine protease